MGAATLLRRTSSGFSPANLPGLALWLKAAAITGLADGAAVATWPDSSGNGRDFSQATAASRPTFRTGVLNGHPTVRFDGANDFVGGASLAGLTAAEVFIILNIVTDPPAGAGGLNTGLWSMGTVASASHYPFSDGVVYEAFGQAGRHPIGNPSFSLAAWRLYNVNSIAGEWTARFDGTQFFTAGGTVVELPTSPLLGKSSLDYYLAGDIAELILYGRKVSTAERAQVNAYVASKYGLTIA